MNEVPDDLRAVEATLFAAEEPMTAEEIRDYVGVHVDVAGALAALQLHYGGRGVELVERGKRWHFQTAPSRRWRSSPTTSPSAARRSKRSEASRYPKGRSTC